MVVFLTPPDTPTEQACRQLTIPSSREWLGIFNAALLLTCQPWNYVQVNDTDMTPEETAAAMYDLFVTYLASTCETGSSEIQAPFWDESSGDDADDSVAPEDQTWYGQWDGESFTESLAYAFLTNFISTLVGTGAAIKFLTIPRAFRVAIRQNPHGANLLLFMDGGLYAVINGYSLVEQVVETIVVSPGSELMLVVDDTHDPDATPNADGDFVVDVVRGRLAEEDVLPPNVRYTGTPAVFQTSPDGGATWVTNAAADPRYNTAGLLPPLTPYGAIKCDGAARLTGQLKDAINNFIAAGDAAQWATGVIALLVLPFGWVGWGIDLFLLIADTLIDIGQANISAAFTTAVYNDITCIFHCYIDANGQITQARLDQAYDAIVAAHPGVVANTINEIRQIFAFVPSNNAIVERDETGDCSACAACTAQLCYTFPDATEKWWFRNPFAGANNVIVTPDHAGAKCGIWSSDRTHTADGSGSLKGTACGVNGTNVRISVVFDLGAPVNIYEYHWYHYQGILGGITRVVYFYNDQMGYVTQRESASSNQSAGWNAHDNFSITTLSGIRYVQILLEANPSLGSFYLDDVCIKFNP